LHYRVITLLHVTPEGRAREAHGQVDLVVRIARPQRQVSELTEPVWAQRCAGASGRTTQLS
jgi:hypothetical protein